MLQRPYSTLSIRTNKNYSSNLMNNNRSKSDSGSKFAKQNNNPICQSPKIYSGKMRYILENKKLFSLMDLDEKTTNSKGPSLPIQFKRLTPEEIRFLFDEKTSNAYKKNKKLKCSSLRKNFLNKIKIPKEIIKNNKNETNINSDINDKNLKSENNAFENEKTDTENNIQKYISHTEQDIEIKKNKKDEILKRPNTSRFSNLHKKINYNFENNKNNNNKFDIWMPTNYKNYELLVKDRDLFIEKMRQNPFFNRLPSCTIKDIQSKVNSTDIFFLNPPTSNSKFNSYINYKENIKKNNNTYFLSDIFNVKNDEISIQKIDEKYILNNNQNKKYTTDRKSKSQ